MPLYYVYKKEWCKYSENRGLIIKSSSWQRAKGIAMAYWGDQDKGNVLVRVYEEIEEGIICDSDDGIWNNTFNN